MDIVTLGAALNGSAEYVNSHFVGGSNIQIVDNPDGTQTINASGEVSSEDTVARADIAAIKDGETLDSFGDVETALATKANTSTTYTKTEVDTALDDKVDKVSGKGLSTNDYTTAEKTKIAGIAEGAEVNEIESIKVNNTTINPDANKVVNITVPTTAADVSALPDTTKYAVALSLTINSSTFVMTGQLKDQNGDNLGTAQTIDLPLESVVVGGSYNSQTKKVVLTLQNGNTIEFSVADLVSGLQTELSTSNKLNPAFIEYDSTHRAVSDTEKSAWNSKQNALTTAQLAAVNSGIDSIKVEQIETNKNNISLLEQMNGAKNLAPYNSDEYIGNAGYWFIHSNCIDILAGTSVYIVFNYTQTAGQFSVQLTDSSGDAISGTYVYSTAGTTSGHKEAKITIPAGKTAKGYNSYLNTNATVSISNFMIVPAEIYEAGFTDYQPYAMSNAELTAKRQTRRLGRGVTSFTVETPPFGTGTIVKVYIYKGTPDQSLSEYILASESVSLVCGGNGVSYSISGSIVTFTTTSTCIAYAETLHFDV